MADGAVRGLPEGGVLVFDDGDHQVPAPAGERDCGDG